MIIAPAEKFCGAVDYYIRSMGNGLTIIRSGNGIIDEECDLVFTGDIRYVVQIGNIVQRVGDSLRDNSRGLVCD